MRKTTAYITSDGQMFLDEQQAKTHERVSLIENLVNQFPCSFGSPQIYKSDIVNYLNANLGGFAESCLDIDNKRVIG